MLVSQPNDVFSGVPNQNIDSLNSISSSDFLPAGRGFKITGLNINSLIKHIDDLRILLANRSIEFPQLMKLNLMTL